jgi:hypothetical protein
MIKRQTLVRRHYGRQSEGCGRHDDLGRHAAASQRFSTVAARSTSSAAIAVCRSSIGSRASDAAIEGSQLALQLGWVTITLVQMVTEHGTVGLQSLGYQCGRVPIGGHGAVDPLKRWDEVELPLVFQPGQRGRNVPAVPDPM